MSPLVTALPSAALVPPRHQHAKDMTLTQLETPEEAFRRWRPSYHLIASRGWMNDPCAPGYLPATGTYHVGFQWNPQGAEWGDIAWGKAFSRDLVRWEVSETPSLERDTPYDHAGVFTGCLVAEEEATFVYTSVSRLPIHYTKQYHRGCETLSLASSADGGRTWAKKACNPILPGPPEGVDATGWRDPFVAPWPAARRLLAHRSRGSASSADSSSGEAQPEPLFGIISGGIRNKTPTTWLYRIDNPRDLSRWTYVGPLVQPGNNFAPSRWTGDLGVNWEVTNFVSLPTGNSQDGPATQDFLIFGAEGCLAPHGGAGTVPGTPRCNRAQLWIAIDGQEETAKDDAPLMKFAYGGVFDHGLYYAANGFHDPITNSQVVIGWVTEEDLPPAMAIRQGWSGCLALPRVVSVATLHNVVAASSSPLSAITSISTQPEPAGPGHVVRTLSIRPDPRLEALRTRATRRESTDGHISLTTAQWEAQLEISGVRRSGCARVGMRIRHSAGAAGKTTVLAYVPREETFVVQRPDVYVAPGVTGTAPTKLQEERAPFTLFRMAGNNDNKEEEEKLRIHVFYDGSVIEVFVNERAAITTRVYLERPECSALEFFVEPMTAEGRAEDDGCVLERATVWDGLLAA